MAKLERVRERIVGPLTPEYLHAKAAEGFRPVAIEWERELPGGEDASDQVKYPVPYGLKVSADCLHLEENGEEKEAMRIMIALLVDDRPFSQVAEELNRKGFRTRSGAPWTQVSVFNLIPRIIEASPGILGDHAWFATKEKLLKVV